MNLQALLHLLPQSAVIQAAAGFPEETLDLARQTQVRMTLDMLKFD